MNIIKQENCFSYGPLNTENNKSMLSVYLSCILKL